MPGQRAPPGRPATVPPSSAQLPRDAPGAHRPRHLPMQTPPASGWGERPQRGSSATSPQRGRADAPRPLGPESSPRSASSIGQRRGGGRAEEAAALQPPPSPPPGAGRLRGGAGAILGAVSPPPPLPGRLGLWKPGLCGTDLQFSRSHGQSERAAVAGKQTRPPAQRPGLAPQGPSRGGKARVHVGAGAEAGEGR